MRTGTKGLNESALEKKLDEIIFVFRYLEDKDLFSKVRQNILNLFKNAQLGFDYL